MLTLQEESLTDTAHALAWNKISTEDPETSFDSGFVGTRGRRLRAAAPQGLAEQGVSLTRRKVLHNQQAARERTEEVKVSCNTGRGQALKWTHWSNTELRMKKMKSEEESIQESKAKGQN